MSKIYPRLERKKLKKIEAGKKPYKTLDDKTMYTFLFEKGMAKNGWSGFILDQYGEFSGVEAGAVVSDGGEDDDMWDDGDYNDAPALVAGFRDNKPSVKSEFDPMRFTMQEVMSLHNAYLDGKLEKMFSKMVEDKAAGRPTRTYTFKPKAKSSEVEVKQPRIKIKNVDYMAWPGRNQVINLDF